MSDLSATLSLLAGALAGQPVALEFSTRARGHSDGSTIYLPATSDPVSAEARRLVICQASLMRSGTYAKDILRTLNRANTAVVQRYLLLEVLRSCAAYEHMLPRSFTTAMQVATAGPRVSRSPVESLRRAQSTERLPATPEWFGELLPAKVLSAGNATSADPSTGGDASDDDLGSDADDHTAGGRSRIMELLSAPMRNALGDAFQKLLGMGQSSGEGAAGEEVPITGARRANGDSAKGRLVPGSGFARIEMTGQLVTGAAYPEWDNVRCAYREDWTLVGEFDPAVTGCDDIAAAQPHRRLTGALAQLGLAWEEHAGEPVGDNLDLTALVDLRTRLAAGIGGEGRVYTANRRTSQRLGVLILLDATGSTAENSDGGQIFTAQRNLAYDLTSALDRLGVRTASYGFYSRGRRNVRLLHAKSFDEPWTMAARRRLLSINPSGFTRLGAAIRHATTMVATRAGTDHQLVVVIGDGVVYDDGYEGSYATEDCRFAIDEAAARGVALVCLSVTPAPDDSIWPPDQFTVAHDADELAGRVRELFGRALHLARSARSPLTLQRSPDVGARV